MPNYNYRPGTKCKQCDHPFSSHTPYGDEDSWCEDCADEEGDFISRYDTMNPHVFIPTTNKVRGDKGLKLKERERLERV